MPFEKLAGLEGGESSSVIRARVEAARAVQAERFAPLGKPHVLLDWSLWGMLRSQAKPCVGVGSAALHSVVGVDSEGCG